MNSEFMTSQLVVRGGCGTIWFGFEHKIYSNREIKMHAVWFGSVGL
jgi:hypothetical protein